MQYDGYIYIQDGKPGWSKINWNHGLPNTPENRKILRERLKDDNFKRGFDILLGIKNIANS